jgi:hypothetical protein
VPGAGHLLLGYTKRAVAWFLSALLLIPATLLLAESLNSALWIGVGLATALSVALVVQIANVVDFLRVPVLPARLPSRRWVTIGVAIFILVSLSRPAPTS